MSHEPCANPYYREPVRVQTESIDAAFVRLERDTCGVKLTIEDEERGDTSVYLSTAALRKLQSWDPASPKE